MNINNEIRFDWDEEKDRENQRKHGVSFEEAKSAFFDDYSELYFDEDHSDDEDRFILLGKSAFERLLLVIHCYREDDSIIKIISQEKLQQKRERVIEVKYEERI